MGTQRVVAAHHDVEQPVARGLLGIVSVGRAGQHLGVDARHEGCHQGHLVGIDAIEIGHAQARGLGHVAQRHGGEALLRDQAEKGIEGSLVDGFHPASSFDRREAAANALSNTGWMPSSAINTFSASAVVPPGLVTLTRNWDAGSLDCFSSSPLPATVVRASCMAISGASPSLAPAAAIASTSRKT